MRVVVKMDIEKALSRFRGRAQGAREALAGAVLRDCAAYVPYRTGELAASGHVADGGVVWDAGHARAVYYARGKTFGRQVHPAACAQWFERAKAVHGGDWVRAAGAAVKG